MSALHPTPTRLALLADVAAGHVAGSLGSEVLCMGARVNQRISEMRQANWIDRATDDIWYLTVTGRMVLDQHRRAD